MTDTGQVPGEGQPENAGGHPGQPQPAAAPSAADAGPTELPGTATPPGEYPYLDPADGAAEDDDLLLMPGAQGAWSEQPAAQPLPQPQETHQGPQQGAPYDASAQAAGGFEPMPGQAGDHESGGRDSGSVDLSAVRIPQPAAPQQSDRARAAAPTRRPLHMGPPVPDPTGGVVRSLADRGPAEVPSRAAGPAPAGAPEYFDAPAEAPQGPEAVAPGAPAAAQPAAGLPGTEQPATPQQPVAAVPQGAQLYVDPAYAGQLSAEQTYGAAGQGPLPGPQLGEIPSQTPSWGEAPVQAAPAPAPEAAAPVEEPVPAEAAQPAPQDTAPAAGQPTEQPQAMPLPAEGTAPAVAHPVADAAVVDAGAAAVAEAVPGTPDPAPMPPQVPAAETAPQDATVPAPADEPAAAPTPEAAAPDTTAPDTAAPDTAVQDAAEPSAAAEPAPADGPQPVAQAPADTQDAAAEVPAQDAPVPDAPAPDAPASDAPVQPAAEPAESVAPNTASAPEQSDVGAESAQPAAPAADAPAADAAAADAAAVETPDNDAPAEPTAPADEAVAAPVEATPATEPAPVDGAAPVDGMAPADSPAAQDPAAPPVPEDSAPAEQTVIEPPEAQQSADGQSQPAAADAAGQQTAEAPVPEPAPQAADAPDEQQPVGQDTPAEADTPADAAPAADTPADSPADTAAPESAVADPAEAADTVQPVTVHIPAQADGEQAEAQATAAAAAQDTAAAADDLPAPVEQTPDSGPDAHGPQQLDASELVQLGEDDAQDGQDAREAQDGAPPQAAAIDGPAEATEGPEAGQDAPGDPDSVPAAGYDDSERAAVHRVMRERRDIRNGFRSDPIPNDVLLRVLEAAHTAPSVGHSQPWDFVVIRSAETREKMHQLAMQQREAYAKSLPKARAKQFRELKIEAILETPVNIVVTADSTRGGRHTLGRHTQPQMAPYSSALAVENLWLAARAEGLGVGWVSFFDEREMVRELDLPEHLEVVAYLCVGYVDEFPEEPELLQAGWSKRRPLSWVVHEETYGRRALPGESPHDLLQETLQGIRPLDAKALGEAWERQKRMTKPAGALGMLEIISAQLCGLSRKCPPPIPEPAAVAIFAGDHGVHAQGVTPWPQEVTGQMVANFLGGGAVCNAFANQVGAEVCVVDVGVAGELPATPGLLPRKVRAGTADFTAGPAMTHKEVFKAIEVGIETARDLIAAGNKVLLTGEMGIANTTTSAALIAVYTGVDPAEVTGRGTGINDETHARKVDVVRRALELHQPDPADPVGVLAAVGGLEHAALVGLILGGASLRTPVILDGVSAGAAALVARAIAPEALAACIAGHRSAEPGHVAALNKLGLRPLVDLDLRLGEGTGALLALPVVQSAARAMHEVATFDSAGVTEKS
ncbi:nicotinate-nucleotide--dimethylbenzimidazole phosphoribosyltransferase [Streptomyces sp. NPDC056411]|uniref:nicotinate-nucleotide--dimethylbenzimidazole phosphoribosyltransferase n=1 Tax=Streptomyces sp. NPDC056411 TaxID=3345813 RepID=UPI0035DDB331